MKAWLAIIALGATISSGQAVAQDEHGGRAGRAQKDLTRQQAQHMVEETFQRLDGNRDGVLTRQEAEQAAAQFGGSGRAERLVERMFGDAQSLTLPQAEDQAMSRFDRDDLNHDGTVTSDERSEARAVLKSERAVQPSSKEPQPAPPPGAQ
jgi:EF hand domain-containing protein